MSEDSEIEETYSKIPIIKWKIKNFFPLRNEKDYSIDSPYFPFSGKLWMLQIYPKGDCIDNTKGWVSVFLCRADPLLQKDRVSYTIAILKCDGSSFRSFSKISEYKENDWDVCGEPKLLKTSDLIASEDIVSLGGSLTLICTYRNDNVPFMEVTSGVETASQTTSCESVEILQRNFQDLLLGERNSDATIKVKDQEFQVHRWILAARSPVFSAMFDHDTEEKKTGIVNIGDLEPESFKEFLSFLYTGRMNMVSSSNAVGLYKAADKYDLKDLKNECVRFMAEELSVESFYDVIHLASMHNEFELLNIASNFFIENFKTIFLTSEWQLLMKQNTTLANELLVKMSNKKQWY